METLLKICQLFFLIMGIFGVIASSVSSFISMTVAATIYFMSAVISYYQGSWIPLVLGFFALLGMSEIIGQMPQIAPKKHCAPRCGKVERGAAEDR